MASRSELYGVLGYVLFCLRGGCNIGASGA